MKPKQPNPIEGRKFTEIINDLAYGEVDRQLAGALRRLVTACQETQKKGKLTFAIEVDPADGMVELSTKTTVTVPQPSAPSTSFFVTAEGDLTQSDPRQLAFKRVDERPAPLRAVDFPRGGKPADDDNGDES